MPIFPRSNADYNGYVETAVPHIAANAAQLKIPAATINELNTIFGNWVPAYSDAAAKGTRSSAIIRKRKDLRAQLTGKLSEIYKDIPQSALTTDNRLVLHLKERDRVRTRARIMSDAPWLSVSVNAYSGHLVYLRNSATPESKQIPAGQFVLLLYYIGEARLKQADIVFNHVKIITRHVSVIHHDITLAGKTAYYKCCYVNRRGECGPWSEGKSAIVA